MTGGTRDEARVEQTEHGLVPNGEGWFVVNAREARWIERRGRGAYCDFEGEPRFAQVGINVQALGAGEPMSMYHWEADDEDFLVLAGDATLVCEGTERALRAWDFIHCPAGARHVIVGAPPGGCAVLALGARGLSTGPDWGGYTVDAAALRLGAGVERETTDSVQAYAGYGEARPTRYRAGWLPDWPGRGAPAKAS